MAFFQPSAGIFTKPSVWQVGCLHIDLAQPKIMGIADITPGSFFDGGSYSRNVKTALAHAERLLKDGADILDIDGESAQPGADCVPPEEEWRRVAPILAEVAKWNMPVSVNTRCAEIMRHALGQGVADIINDTAALTDEGALALLARQPDTGICLIHMQGLPENMQDNSQYGDVAGEVARYLSGRAETCMEAGIAAERLVLDPGLGLGKNLQHNIELTRHLPELMAETDFPLLISVLRRRMIGELTDEADAAGRVHGSVAATLASVARDVQIVRVHDVKATANTLKVWRTLGVFQPQVVQN